MKTSTKTWNKEKSTERWTKSKAQFGPEKRGKSVHNLITWKNKKFYINLEKVKRLNSHALVVVFCDACEAEPSCVCGRCVAATECAPAV